MRKSLGISYLGSKNTIADEIVEHIINENPKIEHVWDLCGGGGAISHAFLKRQIKVHFNEKHTGVCNFIKELNDGKTDDLLKWCSRERFFEEMETNGSVKTLFSFNSNLTNYTFSKKNEEIHKIAHELVVNLDTCNLNLLTKTYEKLNIDAVLSGENYDKRKNTLHNELLKKHNKQFIQINLYRAKRALKFSKFIQGKLIIHNECMFNLNITTPEETTVIYIDPPYENTWEYSNKMNYKILTEYVKNSNFKIYMSGYENNYLKQVFEIRKQSSVQTNAHTVVKERLFANR